MERRQRSKAPAGRRRPRQSRVRTLAVMAITAAIIAAVAFIVNQPTAAAGDVTNVTLNGEASTGQAPTVGQPAPDFSRDDGRRPDGQPERLQGPAGLADVRGQLVPALPRRDPRYQRGLRAPEGRWPRRSSRSSSPRTPPAVRDYADRVGLTYDKVADPDTDDRLRSTGSSASRRTSSSIAAGVLREMKIGSLDQAAMEQAIAGIRQ